QSRVWPRYLELLLFLETVAATLPRPQGHPKTCPHSCRRSNRGRQRAWNSRSWPIFIIGNHTPLVKRWVRGLICYNRSLFQQFRAILVSRSGTSSYTAFARVSAPGLRLGPAENRY